MDIRAYKSVSRLFTVLLLLFLSACATTHEGGEPNVDPVEPVNRLSYDLNETLDQTLLKPIAETYVAVTPQPVRNSVTNFFDNIAYLNVVLHSFLQGKFDQGMQDLLRVLYNSTLGVAGLFDVGTAWGLPENREDFGQTLAAWGFEPGAYLYIPLGGPDTTRNLPNRVTSTLLNPLTYINSTVLFPLTALNLINTRAELLDETNIRDEAAVDPYTFTREAYLQQRQYLIHDGNPPIEGYDDIFDEANDSDGSTLVIE